MQNINTSTVTTYDGHEMHACAFNTAAPAQVCEEAAAQHKVQFFFNTQEIDVYVVFGSLRNVKAFLEEIGELCALEK